MIVYNVHSFIQVSEVWLKDGVVEVNADIELDVNLLPVEDAQLKYRVLYGFIGLSIA